MAAGLPPSPPLDETIARNQPNFRPDSEVVHGTLNLLKEAAGKTVAELAADAAFTGAFAPLASLPGATVVFFGDSITYQSGAAVYTDDANRGATAYNMWCEALTKGRLTPLYNAGIGGDTTAQMLARIEADVIAHAPRLCIMQGGINDVKGVGVAAATTIANLEAMFDLLHAAGIFVIMGTVTPSSLVDTLEERQKLFTVNRWLIEQGRSRRGFTVVDLYTLVADRQTVTWRTGYHSDGTHQSPVGAYTIGKAYADVVNHMFPAVTTKLSRSAADPYEMLPNPTMDGDTAGVATSVTRTGGTGTASKVARTDGIPGAWQQWENTSGTNFIFQTATAGFVAGDRVVFRIELEADSYVGTSHLIYCEYRDAGSALVGTGGQVALADANGAPGTFSGVFESNPDTVPATATSVRVAHRMTGTGTVRIGAMSLRLAE